MQTQLFGQLGLLCLSSLPAPWVSSGIFKFPLIFFSMSKALADAAIAPLPQRKKKPVYRELGRTKN